MRSPTRRAPLRDSGGIAPGNEWTFAPGGKAARVTITAALSSNQIDPMLDACVQGVGLGQFLSYQVAALLETRALKRVLADFEPPPLPIHAIYPSARLLSSNVRALVDWAVPRLRARVPAFDI